MTSTASHTKARDWARAASCVESCINSCTGSPAAPLPRAVSWVPLSRVVALVGPARQSSICRFSFPLQAMPTALNAASVKRLTEQKDFVSIYERKTKHRRLCDKNAAVRTLIRSAKKASMFTAFLHRHRTPFPSSSFPSALFSLSFNLPPSGCLSLLHNTYSILVKCIPTSLTRWRRFGRKASFLALRGKVDQSNRLIVCRIVISSCFSLLF